MPNQRRDEQSEATEQQHAKSAANQRRSTRVSSQSAEDDKREQRNADHRVENRMLWYQEGGNQWNGPPVTKVTADAIAA